VISRGAASRASGDVPVSPATRPLVSKRREEK
jgi:hypothetical protein